MVHELLVAEAGAQAHQEQGVDHQPGRQQATTAFEPAALGQHPINELGVADGRKRAESELTRRRWRQRGGERRLGTHSVDLPRRQVEGQEVLEPWRWRNAR
jgi:hypothetical protein